MGPQHWDGKELGGRSFRLPENLDYGRVIPKLRDFSKWVLVWVGRNYKGGGFPKKGRDYQA